MDNFDLNFGTGGNYSGTMIPQGSIGVDTAALGNLAPTGGAGSGPWQPTAWDRFLGYTDPSNGAQVGGWGSMALNGFSALSSAWFGMKQLDLAKDEFKESKRQFNLNFDAQANVANERLESRQAARVASNPNAYQSVGSVMDKYSIKRGG